MTEISFKFVLVRLNFSIDFLMSTLCYSLLLDKYFIVIYFLGGTNSATVGLLKLELSSDSDFRFKPVSSCLFYEAVLAISSYTYTLGA